MVHSKTNSNLNLNAALHEASASEGCVEVRATLAQPAETSSIKGKLQQISTVCRWEGMTNP